MTTTNEPTILDLERVRDLLKQIANDHPDFIYKKVYEACVYLTQEDSTPCDHETGENKPIPEGAPRHCIVGEVFSRLGVDDKVLSTWSGSIGGDTMKSHIRGAGFELTLDACGLLGEAQAEQDGSYDKSWGEIVKELCD